MEPWATSPAAVAVLLSCPSGTSPKSLAAVLSGLRVTVRWPVPVLPSTSSMPFPSLASWALTATPWVGSLFVGLLLIRSSTSPRVLAPWTSTVKLTPSLRVIWKSAPAGKSPLAAP